MMNLQVFRRFSEFNTDIISLMNLSINLHSTGLCKKVTGTRQIGQARCSRNHFEIHEPQNMCPHPSSCG